MSLPNSAGQPGREASAHARDRPAEWSGKEIRADAIVEDGIAVTTTGTYRANVVIATRERPAGVAGRPAHYAFTATCAPYPGAKRMGIGLRGRRPASRCQLAISS